MQSRIRSRNFVEIETYAGSKWLNFMPLVYISSSLRLKKTKRNNGVRDKKISPPKFTIFYESVSAFSLCVIINPSLLQRREIGMVLVYLTLLNSRINLHIWAIIYKRIVRLK